MSKGKILVIDDSPLVRKLAEVSLQEAGYEVFTADNGEDGVKIAENIIPDLILVDFIMPKMTGSQVCQILKENEKLKDIPILLITGKGESVVQAFIEKYGIKDYFTKPFKSEDLIEKVDMLLSKIVTEKVESEVSPREEFAIEKEAEEKVPEFFEPELKLIPEEEVTISEPEKTQEEIEFTPSEEIKIQPSEKEPTEISFPEELPETHEQPREELLKEEQETTEPESLESIEIPEPPLIEEKLELPEMIFEEEESTMVQDEISEPVEDLVKEEIPPIEKEIPKFDLEKIEGIIDRKLQDFYLNIDHFVGKAIESTIKRIWVNERESIILSGKGSIISPFELMQLLYKAKATGFLMLFSDNWYFEFLFIDGKIVYGITNAVEAKENDRFLRDYSNEDIRRITKETLDILMKTEIESFMLEERNKESTYLDSLPRYAIDELFNE